MLISFGATLCFFLYAVPWNLFKRYSGNSMSKKMSIKGQLKFAFSKKAIKLDKIFTVDIVSVKSTLNISSIFGAFLEITIFKRINPFKNPLCNYSMLSLVHFARKKTTVQSGEAIYQVRNRACRATHNCAM